MPYRALPVAFASQFEASGGGDGVGCRDGPCVGVAPARSPAVGPGGRASVVGLPLQTPARDADGRRRAGPRGAQWHGGRRRPSRPRASRRPSLRDVERAECVCDSQAEPAPRRQGVAGGRGRTCAGGTRACRVDETPKYPELATFSRRILITNITLASLGGSGNGGSGRRFQVSCRVRSTSPTDEFDSSQGPS